MQRLRSRLHLKLWALATSVCLLFDVLQLASMPYAPLQWLLLLCKAVALFLLLRFQEEHL